VDKSTLDNIIEKHRAQPVGHGYIDIIVSRDNYREFVSDLINNGYKIMSISWWEWCQNGKKNEYGLGGPESTYHDGWFSELPIELDDIDLEIVSTKNKIEQIIRTIETKSIPFPGETITFKQNSWLTPAIWLDVPDDWRNKYSA
jgi:hypothetical protein